MNLGARLLTTRWFVRAPIGLFRIGLGPLFVGRLLLLEHRGRTSGRRRFVVLETVARPSRDEVVVAAGFGDGSAWLRNLRAEPRCFVSIGRRRRVPSVARVLDDDDRAEILADYERRHPGAWHWLQETIVEATGDPAPDVPLVRLSLAGWG